MKYLKNYRRKIALCDILTQHCMRILNLSTNDKGEIIRNKEIMEWSDMETISLFNPIPYDNDKIDAVLFFGDGTIEFHFEKECDARNWAEFSNDYIKLIIEELKDNQCYV